MGMTEEEYALQLRELGREVHINDGVWWEKHHFGYCKPAYEFRSFRPGEAKPKFKRSFIGYSHPVPVPSDRVRTLRWMILDGEALGLFSLSSISGKKRNQVRKGLKNCEVRRLDDVERHLEEMRQINISQAERQMGIGDFGLPVRYYIDEAELWRRDTRRWFSLENREWWGAFVDGMLGAYMVTYQVESVRFIGVMKSHTQYLRNCVTDAIYFTVLELAGKDESCKMVVNGGPMRPVWIISKNSFCFPVVKFLIM